MRRENFMGTHSKDRLPRLSVLAVSSICLLFFITQLSGYYHDDAYIVLRYVQNFLDGHGLVFNPGERVEGYSQFLWMILISLLGYFRIDLMLASRILGTAFAFATLLLFYSSDKKAPAWGGLLLTTNSYFALWAIGGMETIAFGFFLFLACRMYLGSDKSNFIFFSTGCIFSLAAMLRPAGLLFFGITFCFILFKDKQLTQANIKKVIFYACGFMLIYAPYYIWRFWYYGYPLPCTYYVKGGVDLFKLFFGGRYIIHFLISCSFPILCIFLLSNKKLFLKRNLYLISLLSCFGLYVLSVGGDHMQGYRFLTPILPLFYLLIQNIFTEISMQKPGRTPLLIFMTIIILNLFISLNAIPRSPDKVQEALRRSDKYRYSFGVPDPAGYIGKHVGLYIKENWPEDATIAVNTAGSTPYFSGLKTIDMLGLNDYNISQREIVYNYDQVPHTISEFIALLSPQGRKAFTSKLKQQYLPWQLIPGHGKGNGRYVLSRRPDYIILGGAHGAEKAWFIGDQEILDSPDFSKNYERHKVRIPVTDKYYRYYPVTENGFLTFTYYKKK